MNKYMQEAKEIRKAIDTFAENQTDETLLGNKRHFLCGGPEYKLYENKY